MSPDSVKPYHEGDYNVQQRDLLGVASFGLFLSTLAVGLRVVARRRLSVALWWDDYLAISALVSITGRRDGGRRLSSQTISCFPTYLLLVLLSVSSQHLYL